MTKKMLPLVFIALLATIPLSMAQEWQDDISRIFARDGMAITLFGSRETTDGERFDGVTVGVPGHMRLDGWFIGPGTATLGATIRNGSEVSLPTLSFPLRRAEVALHGGKITGLALNDGGLLDQDFSTLTFAPVTISKDDGVFGSIDEMIIERVDDCFNVVINGMAISSSRTIPAIAAASGTSFYKGDGKIRFSCEGSNWHVEEINITSPGLGVFHWNGDVAFNPKEILDLIVRRRTEMNSMFTSNIDIPSIVIADAMLYLDVASLMNINAFSFTFEDDGVIDDLKKGLESAAWLGSRDRAIKSIVSFFPDDLQSKIEELLTTLIENGGILTTSMQAENMNIGDLAIGDIPAQAWSITVND